MPDARSEDDVGREAASQRPPGKSGNSDSLRKDGARRWYLLLLLPFIGLLWVPLYATATPKLFGFPFFYWYQFAWVLGTALLTWIVFRKVR